MQHPLGNRGRIVLFAEPPRGGARNVGPPRSSAQILDRECAWCALNSVCSGLSHHCMHTPASDSQWRLLFVMFVLSELQDIVRIEPHKFSQDTEQQIRDELNRKFANKVRPQCYSSWSWLLVEAKTVKFQFNFTKRVFYFAGFLKKISLSYYLVCPA